MRCFVFCLTVAIALLANRPVASKPMETVEDPSIGIRQGLDKFSIKLLKETSRLADPKLNIILSPFSVWTILLLIYEGSKGSSASQISKALGFPNKHHLIRNSFLDIEKELKKIVSGVTFESVNGIFTDKNRPIEDSYNLLIKKTYHSNILPINFAKPYESSESINQWIRMNTNNRINSLIRPEDLLLAQVVLANVIYFKGAWAIPFNQSETETADFFDEQNNFNGKVSLMTQRAAYQFSLVPALDSQVVELPYQGSTLAMLVILPQMGATVETVLQKLADKVTVADIYDKLQDDMDYYGDNDVIVSLPKFKITSDFTINVVLEQLGIVDVFSPSKANLSGISASSINDSMYISRVMHKAEIEVNEEGTEASAVTSSIFVNKATTPHFKANKPFIFLIVEKTTKVILFSGKYSSPMNEIY